jgi:hypothetical protein
MFRSETKASRLFDPKPWAGSSCRFKPPARRRPSVGSVSIRDNTCFKPACFGFIRSLRVIRSRFELPFLISNILLNSAAVYRRRIGLLS